MTVFFLNKMFGKFNHTLYLCVLFGIFNKTFINTTKAKNKAYRKKTKYNL